MNPNASSSIEERIESEFAKAWTPEPGDTLVGEVVELGERDGGYGSYPIVTLRLEDGSTLAVHAFHTVLANQLAEQRPKVGERLAVKYLGKIKGENSKGAYHAYRVLVERDKPSGFNWARYSDGHEPGTEDDKFLESIEPEHADDDPLPY